MTDTEPETHAFCETCDNDVVLMDGRCLYCDGAVTRPSGTVRPSGGGKQRSSPEHRWHRALRQVQLAEGDPAVAELRERLLGGSLIASDEVEDWLETRAGEPPGIGKEVAYARPGDTFARFIHSSEELEPLRELSETLACRYGWLPAEATTWLLTGTIPAGGAGVRRTTTWKFGKFHTGEPVFTVRDALGGDAEPLAAAKRKAQAEYGTRRQPRVADEQRDAKLAAHVEQHGRGEEARRLWNIEAIADGNGQSYGNRQSWHRAVKRAVPGSCRG